MWLHPCSIPTGFCSQNALPGGNLHFFMTFSWLEKHFAAVESAAVTVTKTLRSIAYPSVWLRSLEITVHAFFLNQECYPDSACIWMDGNEKGCSRSTVSQCSCLQTFLKTYKSKGSDLRLVSCWFWEISSQKHQLINSSSFLRCQTHCLQTWHINASPQSTRGPIRAHQGRAGCHFPSRQDICVMRGLLSPTESICQVTLTWIKERGGQRRAETGSRSDV